ncbi:MAG: D-2-hydroxyacid dehydrogenase family protein [Chloroflexota bacterium]
MNASALADAAAATPIPTPILTFIRRTPDYTARTLVWAEAGGDTVTAAMQPHFVVLDDWTNFWSGQPAIDRLRARGQVTIHTRPAGTSELVSARIADATVVLLNRERTQIGAAVLERATRLELIAQTGRVSPNIDATAATERGVALIAAGGQLGSHAAVAELGFALLMALARHIIPNDRRVREGDWVAPPTMMLGGSTLGIIGLGHIGQHMARIGQAMNMRVIAGSPTLTPERAQAAGVEYMPFADLFGESDAVLVATKLTDSTRGLIRQTHIASMKPTSYLVNIARGPIVDEAALVDALQRRAIAGAGLDVYDQEPLPITHPLTHLDNVVLAPHIGWGTDRNFALMVENLVVATLTYLDGDMSGVTNPTALDRRTAWATRA